MEDRCLLAVTAGPAVQIGTDQLSVNDPRVIASKVDPALTALANQSSTSANPWPGSTVLPVLQGVVPPKPSAVVVGPMIPTKVSTTPWTGPTSSGTKAIPSSSDLSRKMIEKNDEVVIDATASGSTSALLADLKAIGLSPTGVYGPAISGWLPISSIPKLSGLSSLKLVKPAYQPASNHIEGDEAVRANIARGVNNLDGAGVTVGVLSDSFNSEGGYAADVASGALPADVRDLSDLPAGQGSDEGRAMAQIVHGVAPGANIAFASAALGEASFAQNIVNLADLAGANVITDDEYYFDEPFFQDGIIAQAVDQVASQGVSEFSSAGNQQGDAYESSFRSSGMSITVDGKTGVMQNFDTNGQIQAYQTITIDPYATLPLIFQWNQPFASASASSPGAQSELDVYLIDSNGNVVAAANQATIGGDPYQFLSYTNYDNQTDTFHLVIADSAGPMPTDIKYIMPLDGAPGVNVLDNYNPATPSSFGHSQATGAAGVAAAPYFETPAYGVSPAQVEYFSSAGGTPFYFDANGNTLPTPEIRQQPRITAVDGVTTSVFDPFYGTSAAAPHAAAVAALMIQANPGLSPNQIYTTMESTAVGMNDPYNPSSGLGYNFSTGYGLVDAAAAVASVRTTAISGHIFDDTNNNGLFDDNDTPVVGTTVYIDLNNIGSYQVGDPTQLTNIQGFYAFTGLASGTYTLRAILPTGSVLTTPTAVFTEKLQVNQPAVADFGVSNTTSISGIVFNDFNGDTKDEPTDTPAVGQLVYIDTNKNGKLDTTTTSVPGPAASIDQFDTYTYVPINVTGIAGDLTHLTVTVHLTFPDGNDYEGYGIYLGDPNGNYVLLAPSGAPGSGFFQTTFDDDASLPITSGAPPYTGSFQPEQPLSAFNGENPNGIWYLVTENDYGIGVGSLDSWSLNVTSSTEPITYTDSNGNYQFTGLVPGTNDVATIIPPGLAQSLPLTPEYMLTGAAGQPIAANFGVRQTNAIVGRVVEDELAQGVASATAPGLPNQLVYLDNTGTGIYQGFDFSTDVPLSIPLDPNGGGTGDPNLDDTNSTLTIANVGNPITDVKVYLDVSYPYDTFLTVSLTSPSGTTIILSDQEGGFGSDFSGTIFDDDAATPIFEGNAPFTGSYQPDTPLSTFDGETANGTWTLTINDAFPGIYFTGQLNQWGLVFNGAPIDPITTTDASGKYQFLGVSPGNYVVGLFPSPGYATSFPSAGTQAVTLFAGGLADGDFGLRPTNSIVGHVFRDLNGDGVQESGELNQPGVTIFQDLNGNGKLDTSSNNVNSTDVPLTIDDGDHSTVDSTLSVSGAQPNISHLTVTLNLTFPDQDYDGFEVTLISPTGVRLVLAPAGAPGPGFIDTTFDDSAPTIIFAGSPPYTGSFQPANPLATFNGENPNGTWTLEITNAYLPPGSGQLLSWSMNVTASEPTTTTDASGNYQFTNLVPGPYAIVALAPAGYVLDGSNTSGAKVTLVQGATDLANFSVSKVAPPQIVDIVAHWGIESMSILNLNRDLPWTSLSSIDIVFDSNVAVNPSFFSLIGSSFGSYQFTMSYDPSTYTVTLRIAPGTAFGLDHITLGIVSDASHKIGVQDNPGGSPGNFLAGGNYSFTFGVLPADVDGTKVVNVIDALDIRTDVILGMYDYFADLDGDGTVSLTDYAVARKKNGTRLS